MHTPSIQQTQQLTAGGKANTLKVEERDTVNALVKCNMLGPCNSSFAEKLIQEPFCTKATLLESRVEVTP